MGAQKLQIFRLLSPIGNISEDYHGVWNSASRSVSDSCSDSGTGGMRHGWNGIGQRCSGMWPPIRTPCLASMELGWNETGEEWECSGMWPELDVSSFFGWVQLISGCGICPGKYSSSF